MATAAQALAHCTLERPLRAGIRSPLQLQSLKPLNVEPGDTGNSGEPSPEPYGALGDDAHLEAAERLFQSYRRLGRPKGLLAWQDESLLRACAEQAALGVENINLMREVLTSNGRTLAQGALAWIWGASPLTVPMMHQTEHFAYSEGQGVQALRQAQRGPQQK